MLFRSVLQCVYMALRDSAERVQALSYFATDDFKVLKTAFKCDCEATVDKMQEEALELNKVISSH